MIEVVYRNVEDLVPYDKNPRTIPEEAIDAVAESIQEFGFKNPILIDKDNVIIAGHTRRLASLKLGLELVPCVVCDDLTPQQVKALRLADNKTNELAEWDLGELNFELKDLADFSMDRFGFENLLDDFDRGNDESQEWQGKLQDRFLVPPLSVFDTRQGYWQDRKRIWKEKIHSLDGRESELIINKEFINALAKDVPTTSEFDPVLCEVLVKWFSPDKGRVIDPFAGGSVRGIVSSMLGREYVGVDLSKNQIEANEKNWTELGISENKPTWIVGDSCELDTLVDESDFDLFLTCPPYADLEQYSDDPKDLSNMEYSDFREIYSDIIAKACNKLRDDAFACIVVTEIRDKKTGLCRGFLGDTKEAFFKAGLSLYNDIVLVNSFGTAPARTSHVFPISRKVGRVHQNVLVFIKGDPKKAMERLGDIEVAEIEE